MDLNKMIRSLKKHPQYHSMGMIASHLGIVRGHSLDRRKVLGIEVSFDKNIINDIIHRIEDLSGIVKVLVDVSNGRLEVGDEIMAVVVGGETREQVFPSLIMAVDRIKNEAVKKREIIDNN